MECQKSHFSAGLFIRASNCLDFHRSSVNTAKNKNTFSSQLSLPSHPAPAPLIRSLRHWRCIDLVVCVCMYVNVCMQLQCIELFLWLGLCAANTWATRGVTSMDFTSNYTCHWQQRLAGDEHQAEKKKKERKCNDLKCVRKPTKSRLSLTHHSNKSSRWAE